MLKLLQIYFQYYILLSMTCDYNYIERLLHNSLFVIYHYIFHVEITSRIQCR